MACSCDLCACLSRFEQITAKLDKEDADYIDNFLDFHINETMDLEWFRAVTDGSWPDARKVIEGWLERMPTA